MTLRDLLATLRKRRMVIVVMLVFCVGIAAVYAFSRPQKNYGSSATIAFLPDPNRPDVTPSESVTTLLTTYAVVAESERNLKAAQRILGHPLAGSVVATPGSDSWILAISSEASSSAAAAETASAVTRALLPTIRANGVLTPSVINHPVAAGVPIQARSPTVVIAVAAVLGLVAGILLALLLENLGGLSEVPPTGRRTSTEHVG